MYSIEDRIVCGIDGTGVYFVRHLDHRVLANLKAKLNRTVVGVFDDDSEHLIIEIKEQPGDRQRLSDILSPLGNAEVDRGNAGRPDYVVDSEKFLRYLFEKDSKLSKEYIVLVDATILGRTLTDNDGNLISLQVA